MLVRVALYDIIPFARMDLVRIDLPASADVIIYAIYSSDNARFLIATAKIIHPPFPEKEYYKKHEACNFTQASCLISTLSEVYTKIMYRIFHVLP